MRLGVRAPLGRPQVLARRVAPCDIAPRKRQAQPRHQRKRRHHRKRHPPVHGRHQQHEHRRQHSRGRREELRLLLRDLRVVLAPHHPHKAAAEPREHRARHEQRRRREQVGQLAKQKRRGNGRGHWRHPEQRRMADGRPQPSLQPHDERERDHRHGNGKPREQQVPPHAHRQRLGLRARAPACRIGVEHAEHPGQKKRPAQTPQRREPLGRRQKRRGRLRRPVAARLAHEPSSPLHGSKTQRGRTYAPPETAPSSTHASLPAVAIVKGDRTLVNCMQPPAHRPQSSA